MSFCDHMEHKERLELLGGGATELGQMCNYKKFQNGRKMEWDLTPLQKPANPDASYRDEGVNYKIKLRSQLRNQKAYNDKDYFINICGPLNGLNEKSESGGLISVLEETPGHFNDKNGTHTLSTLDQAKMVSLRDDELRMKMEGGDTCYNGKQRMSEFFFICEDVGLGSPIFADEFSTCEYVFLWPSCVACPLGHPIRNRCYGPGQEPMSFGTKLLIQFMACVFLYIVIGFIYNRFVRGHRGWKQFPHSDFWGSCCGYAKSGPGVVMSSMSSVKSHNANPATVNNLNQGLISDDDSVDDDVEDKLYD